MILTNTTETRRRSALPRTRPRQQKVRDEKMNAVRILKFQFVTSITNSPFYERKREHVIIQVHFAISANCQKN